MTQKGDCLVNRTKDVEFDYQAYMKEDASDLGDIHWGPEARQKRREAVIHNNRGVTYANKGDYDCAIQAFTKAMELNPNLAMAYSNRGGAYRDKGDYDRAIEDCTKAIALNPDLAMAYNNRGVAYYKKRDYDRAIVDYTKAIELKPGFAEGYYNRGEARLHLGEWENAKLDLTVAVAMGVNIIDGFRDDYANVSDFEQRNGVKLPADLAAMLTPQQ